MFDAALADFCNDGMVNRPDLEAIAEQVNQVFEGRQTEIMAAIANRFSECIGSPIALQPTARTLRHPGGIFCPFPLTFRDLCDVVLRINRSSNWPRL